MEEEDRLLETKLIDTGRNKIRQDVLLIVIGDSKGFIHFNHLYL